ncbi:MAG: alpha-galactosidase [Verrucomicrobia bacterium]|nr:alpha-galactosidase [Verrucomicrobiota bacterium]
MIEDIQPLCWSADAGKGTVTVHHARGSDARLDDFEPLADPLPARGSLRLASRGGRSSDGALPFFNLPIGDGGVIGAIGWTGNWAATCLRDEAGRVEARAGLQRTRLRLRPGEEVRTPRILLLNWRGDRTAAHNLWRRLVLAHYTPQVNGAPLTVPASYGVWGADLCDRHIARARRLKEQRWPFDVFWVDAGWYGHTVAKADATVYNTPWHLNQGNWWPSTNCYPQGLKPLGDVLKELGIGFLLWIEPEVAKQGTTLLTEHPEWFLRTKDPKSALLNLGDPAARRGITDLVSKIINDAGLSWYRQDFNIAPESFWAAGDAPDRVGATESHYIEGLYAFWDELRARHPGLQIDNCASGGRRIDLETISRSVPLWRSDYPCVPRWDPIGSQAHTIGLAPWVPLSAAVCVAAQQYTLRSAHAAGIVFDTGMNAVNPLGDAWLRLALEEFKRVRPFCYGDFYPLLDHNLRADSWAAWQFDRPDQRAGVAIFLRRPGSPFTAMEAGLRALDPKARYAVEVRSELGPAPVQHMTGAELSGLHVTIAEKPGSALLIYRQE